MLHTLSGKYAVPLHLEPGSSRLLAAWLMLVHGIPLCLLPALHLSPWLGTLIVAAVLCSLRDGWRRQARRSHPDAVRTITWPEGRQCRLTLVSGQRVNVELASQAFILPWLVILQFNTPQRRYRYLPLLPDMLDETVFRRLRVRLRIVMDQGTA
jgi:hypothetical protein